MVRFPTLWRNPWKHREIFPSIQEAIERLCERGGVAQHESIIDELLNEPEARSVIGRAVQRDMRYNERTMAGTMNAWFSQKHTMGQLGEFSRRFEKEQHGHKGYTYYPAK